MERTLAPGARCGCVCAPVSKSEAHRLLICAALGTEETELLCAAPSEDVRATARCLSALGADIAETAEGFRVRPIGTAPAERCTLRCGESGATLRFLLPLCGALGARAVFLREGRLPQRPLAPLDDCLRAHGMTICEDGDRLFCEGRLCAGEYRVAGNVSSQYVSGLLLALPRLAGASSLRVTGALSSAPYVTMTEAALRAAGVRMTRQGDVWCIPGAQRFTLPPRMAVEGDWSGAAFFLCMGALSARGVRVEELNTASSQGDRAVLALLRRLGAEVEETVGAVTVRRGALRGITIDADAIPDLIPPLAVLAAAVQGETRIENAARLRDKESDRLHALAQMLAALGAAVEETEDTLTIRGTGALRGGAVETRSDHRLAMAAALAACASRAAITLDNDTCVRKSYPRFWEDFARLKGDTP